MGSLIITSTKPNDDFFCAKSWLKFGADVRNMSVKDGSKVRIKTMLEYASQSEDDVIGIFNSDIFLVPDEAHLRLWDSVIEVAKHEFVYLNRCDMPECKMEKYGHDAFLFPKYLAGFIVPNTPLEFKMGEPFWDNWLPYEVWKTTNLAMCCVNRPLIYHTSHRKLWSNDAWRAMAKVYQDKDEEFQTGHDLISMTMAMSIRYKQKTLLL